jgi:hypothetical protein
METGAARQPVDLDEYKKQLQRRLERIHGTAKAAAATVL